MQTTQRILMTTFVAMLAAAALLVLLHETSLMEPGGLAGNEHLEFVTLSVMELVALVSIPLALRLFRFKAIRRQLVEQPARKLLGWGMLRLLMLGVPMLVCVYFYYLFFMEAAFGYLAIILLLSMMFVLPTKGKCEAETTDDSENTENAEYYENAEYSENSDCSDSSENAESSENTPS